ncbi:MAG: heavy metal-binding domain-containing protein [Beijerinckiaceae bacterium]
MRVTANHQFEEARIVREIGRIEAASDWRGQSSLEAQQEAALRKLKALAAEFEADAIVGLDFQIDDVEATDLAPLHLSRVHARGVAVKLARG